MRAHAAPALPHAAGGSDADVACAVREEDGWNAFVATAAWWMGENANQLCGEYAGGWRGGMRGWAGMWPWHEWAR